MSLEKSHASRITNPTPEDMSKRIFFSVGEPSGDQHAARLITHLKQAFPEIQTTGFGGEAMQAAGCDIELDLTKHAVVGILEVLPKLREFFGFADQAEAIFKSGEIDAVVLVDFPGFNWHIAKRAKRYGIPVYYYCPPQLWAWGGWRVRKMRRLVDHVLTVLPIEQSYFTKHNIPATYVGHPFFDAVALAELDEQLLARFAKQTEAGDQLVAVLPGSRTHEVHRTWPVMLESIRRLAKSEPSAKFLVAAYRDRHCLWCRNQLTAADANLPIEFYVDRTSEVIEAARCAMMVSGSVSLELMARRTPAAVTYRIGRFLYAFAKMVVKLDSITLPNLMSPRKVFPEFISVGSTQPAVDFLTQSVGAMLHDEFYYRQTLKTIDELCHQHAGGGATEKAATWIGEKVTGRSDQGIRRAA
ncbi:lipid-A-disaccharide synthase [Rhodopirellula maiorica SM1]|uniref:Lipid-A-disaccharide synthase n=1 Tax=Rhodopirellula maiorica SM1 TaxID=1265738 RepID=M5RJ40_9BACT|nr:lipid-A-disaccharide synthase [Rhodopirellula maiorica]EMI19295.1 lipid-A-disaccharide synthase [Rhodopirellula maiorica SM1]